MMHSVNDELETCCPRCASSVVYVEEVERNVAVHDPTYGLSMRKMRMALSPFGNCPFNIRTAGSLVSVFRPSRKAWKMDGCALPAPSILNNLQSDPARGGAFAAFQKQRPMIGP
jgi:hypothetical protein